MKSTISNPPCEEASILCVPPGRSRRDSHRIWPHCRSHLGRDHRHHHGGRNATQHDLHLGQQRPLRSQQLINTKARPRLARARGFFVLEVLCWRGVKSGPAGWRGRPPRPRGPGGLGHKPRPEEATTGVRMAPWQFPGNLKALVAFSARIKSRPCPAPHGGAFFSFCDLRTAPPAVAWDRRGRPPQSS
jgi:hypothetical protein